MSTVHKGGIGLLLALLLAGCGKQAEAPPEVRPVRTQVAALSSAESYATFSGEVRARVESRLSFRVPGKLVKREVEVGQMVRPGQVLARLDARDLALGESAAAAQLVAAQADMTQAGADLKRFAELRDKNFISAAEFERRSTAYDVAKARYQQAQAQARVNANQAGYAALVADAAGVVTAIDAEVGQVLAAGQPVVRVARPEEKEVLIAVPESRVPELKAASSIVVRLWADTEQSYTGRVREVAPDADPVTRTYAARIAMDGADQAVRLGMTAKVQLQTTQPVRQILLPLSALHDVQQRPAVWVIDPSKLSAQLRPVTLGAGQGNQIAVTAGLKPGERVVTAGVHMLHEGQRVKLLDEAGLAAAPSPALPTPVAAAAATPAGAIR